MRAATSTLRIMFPVFLLTMAASSSLFAQTTIATGSIIGTISDPTGAVINEARITITAVATGQVVNVSTNPSGAFSSGALWPGQYGVVVSTKGFKTAETRTSVLVGNITTLNVTLQVGSERDVLEVGASDSQINTEQATVQGVLDDKLIENLPISGRNYLELAQLEPGVQIQDAANFGFGKDGYSSISFDGRFGRTARVEVDGIDVSDEIFGSTTTNIAIF
jgi:Carboxypeptidase regulatory-like domain